MTIKQLRQQGYKVRVLHTRTFDKRETISGYALNISNLGGHTKIELTTPDTSHTTVGEAACSIKESFNRKIGNAIALGRAINKLETLGISIK
ncbi:MAG: hypothetical protein EBU33_03970 [Sphingobacteriia bacterium]|nr:hypothetical protein [Sphingobacteriia bacterium]